MVSQRQQGVDVQISANKFQDAGTNILQRSWLRHEKLQCRDAAKVADLNDEVKDIRKMFERNVDLWNSRLAKLTEDAGGTFPSGVRWLRARPAERPGP